MPVYLADEDGNYEPAQTRSGAALTILSEQQLLPGEITERIGLSPDRWWLAGQSESHVPETDRMRSRPFNGWEVASRLPEESDVNDHLANLLDRIAAVADRIAELPQDPAVHSVRLWLVHHTDNENPGFSFDHDQVAQVGRLGVGLEIDVYVG